MCWGLQISLEAQTVHSNAHAHNDYEQEQPLFDALKHGFTSVEADIHAIDGQLYVVHDAPKTTEGLPTLEDLYLKPLQDRIQQYEGRVFEGYDDPFFLMIDIKTEASATYKLLQKVLEPYRNMLTAYQNNAHRPGPVTIFLSGNRPFNEVMNAEERWVGLDGRISNIGDNFAPDLMPVISDNFRNHFKWRGTGTMSKKDHRKLNRLVKKVHREGKKLRFWAIPDQPESWEILLHAGVDLINTDRLADLDRFLTAKNK